jgi:dTDP-4-amino-4,6-dideoxygalactose transaminase
LSFHETKNVSSGEGGALVLNDPALIERAEILREKGTNRSSFFRGQVDKYTWVDVGSSYLPSELNAAVLFAQLEVWNIIQSKRHAVWNRYFTELAGWAAANGIRLPIVPAGCEHPAHLFYLLLPSERDRAALIKHLAARGILSVFHYVPLHAAPMGQRLGYRAEDLPITVDVSERLLRLPLYAGMSAEDVDEVVAAILQWQPSTHPAISA